MMTPRAFAFRSGLALRGLAFAAMFCGFGGVSDAAAPPVLVRAHAHNDYWHERPLLDALEQGFASVEADVFLVEGELLVGHDPSELRPERTLEALYLEPIRDRVQKHGGSLFGEGSTGTLLVDIKSDAAQTYGALSKLLAKYAGVLTSVTDSKEHSGAVEVIVSGNRPVEMIASERMRHVAVDGRLAELDRDPPVNLVPLVSESWDDHFRWDGRGEMPADEQAKLREIVNRVHGQGRRLRFWATPETEECWWELVEADVDLIGTDELVRLAGFLGGGEGRDEQNTGRSPRRVPSN